MRVRIAMKIAGCSLAGALLVGACGNNGPGQLGDQQANDGGAASCVTPQPGCPCSGDGTSAACGEVVTRDGNYVTCSEGTMTCKGGTWGACVGMYNVYKSVGAIGGGGAGGGIHLLDLGDAGACMNDPCDPNCNGFTGDNSNDAEAGPGLEPTDGGWTLVPGEGGTCMGLQCQVPVCMNGQTTSIHGVVLDPAAINPVFNAAVMIPNGPVQPVPAGVSSDPCGGATLPPAVSYAYSAVDGSFTLTGVPVGNPVPLVIQIGRWRRVVNIDTSSLQCGQTLDLTGNIAPTCGVTTNITNPGFETGNFNGWTTSGAFTTISNTAHTGSYSGQAGANVPTNGDSNIVQTFTAPAGATSLSFWYNMVCPDSVVWDWATATLTDNTTSTTTTVLQPICSNAGWQQVTAPVNAGDSYTLTLTNHDDDYFFDPSYTLFDDVSWCTGGVNGNCLGLNNYAGSASCLTRLPRTQSEGNIPHIAIATGGLDAMECMLYRMGVSSSEYTDENGAGRIHMFHNGGSVLGGGNANHDLSYLLGFSCPFGWCPASPTDLTHNYDLIMLPCDGGAEYNSGSWSYSYDDTGRQNLVNYTAVGGRLFTSHWGREWIERPYQNQANGPYPGVANWTCDGCTLYGGASPDTGYFDKSTMRGTNLANWMGGVTGNSNSMQVNPTRFDVRSIVAPPSTQFVYAWSDNNPNAHPNQPDVVFDMTFDTPLGGMATGRAMYTDMHLANGIPGGTFPGNCPTQGSALLTQEDAAEYLLFDLGACVSGSIIQPPQYQPATFTRDFPSSCGMGYKPVWRFFYWEDQTPSDSNIVFDAYTADTQAQLGTEFPVVNLATASGPDNCPNGPSCASSFVGVDVDPKLVAAGQMSLAWLRVSMTLNPSSNKQVAPTLIAWQQMYDCVPSE